MVKLKEKLMNRLITVSALVLLAASLPAVAQVDPCKLLSQAEIESAIGAKAMFAGTAQWGATPTCPGGSTAKHMSIMVMFTPGKADDPHWADALGFLEQVSRQNADSIKAKMDAKRFGSSILCTTLIPPKQGPYSTQCMAVKKPTGMATISILVPAQQDMVSMDALRSLAEKMLARF
jgi:hypothetical protein